MTIEIYDGLIRRLEFSLVDANRFELTSLAASLTLSLEIARAKIVSRKKIEQD